MLLNLSYINRRIHQVHLNSITLMGYGSINSIKGQPLISNTSRHKDQNVVRIESNMALFDHNWVSIIQSQSMALSLVALDVSRMIFLVKSLVCGSARFFSWILHISRK